MKISPLVLAIYSLIIYSCTFTAIRYNNPEIDNLDALLKDLGTILKAEEANFVGKHVKTNSKAEKVIEITITNPKNIPEDDDGKKVLCGLIASKVKAHLKDSNDYNLYEVQLVNKHKNGITTKTHTYTFTISAKYVILPNIEMGMKSTTDDGVINTASKFSSKDTGVQCILVNYTFIDTSSLAYSIRKKSDTAEELIAKVKIHAIPYSYFSKTINMQEFSIHYGKGKFYLEIFDHNRLIAAKNFEVQ